MISPGWCRSFSCEVMIESQKAFLVIGATLLIVVLINLALYTLVKRRKPNTGEVDLIRRAMKQARDPWKDEQTKLDSLSRQVAELQNQSNREDAADGE
jgi:uncharacterized protein YlxW (UPF0749 family)